MLATFNIFMIDKTDINQFTCFYKNFFFQHVYTAKQFIQDDNNVVLPHSVPLEIFQQIFT